MAKQKQPAVESGSTTLAGGTRVYGPKELIDRLSGGGSAKTSTTSTSRKTSDTK